MLKKFVNCSCVIIVLKILNGKIRCKIFYNICYKYVLYYLFWYMLEMNYLCSILMEIFLFYNF